MTSRTRVPGADRWPGLRALACGFDTNATVSRVGRTQDSFCNDWSIAITIREAGNITQSEERKVRKAKVFMKQKKIGTESYRKERRKSMYFPNSLRQGSDPEMILEPARLLLVFREPKKREQVEETLHRLHFIFEEPGAEAARPRGGVHHTDTRFWVKAESDKPITEEQLDRIEAAFGGELDFISAVYRIAGMHGLPGLVSPLANILLIKVPGREGAEHPGLAAVIARYGLREMPEKSRYLGGFRYFVIEYPKKVNAYELRERLLSDELRGAEIEFEIFAAAMPLASVPNDPLFFLQWDMAQIDAPAGWNLATGTGVIIAILDTGVDQTHPDINLASPGINLGTMLPPGSPIAAWGFDMGHGTCCSGLAAARINNNTGVAGVAGNARILPLASPTLSNVEVAAGINFAAAAGARVISMSFTIPPIGLVDSAIANAVNVHGLVLCAATGNNNSGVANGYPSTNPLVIACGGSDESDNRKRPASPDGEGWGANFGPGISVVAPAVRCPTTDIQGVLGFNSNGGPISIVGVNYPTSGDPAGNFFFEFNGTSSATPHVAGYAALLASAFPSLTSAAIRRIIERTAAKVGSAPYLEVPGFPNGTRTAELGYGRIDIFHGLDLADVMIRDWPGDNGIEPSTSPAGDYWDSSDVVVRPKDDNVFQPSNPALSSEVLAGRTNYIYVRVENLGPRVARNVVVNVRLTPNGGAPFVYPHDWAAIDPTHLHPTPIFNTFSTVPVSGTVIAKFKITEDESEALWHWVEKTHFHPSVLAVVTADNDYAFAPPTGGPPFVPSWNNLAQRNLNVVPQRRHHHEPEEVLGESSPEVDVNINIKVRGREVEIGGLRH
jgi:hypothetical protein